MVDVTSVVLGLMTLLGGCGWFIDRRKHRQEIESMKADIRRKEPDLGTETKRRITFGTKTKNENESTSYETRKRRTNNLRVLVIDFNNECFNLHG